MRLYNGDVEIFTSDTVKSYFLKKKHMLSVNLRINMVASSYIYYLEFFLVVINKNPNGSSLDKKVNLS